MSDGPDQRVAAVAVLDVGAGDRDPRGEDLPLGIAGVRRVRTPAQGGQMLPDRWAGSGRAGDVRPHPQTVIDQALTAADIGGRQLLIHWVTGMAMYMLQAIKRLSY